MSGMAEAIDDSVNCPVCFEYYGIAGDNVPRLLPCTHTVCHKCVLGLLKDNTLTCPQDRKTHLAVNGVFSFVQNKYILKNLQKSRKIDEISVNLEKCVRHGMDKILFCKHDDCQKGICPLCMTENHRNHKVVNIAEEQEALIRKKCTLMKNRLRLHHEKLVAAKRQVADDTRTLINQLRQEKEKVEAEFDKQIAQVQKGISSLNSATTSTIENRLQLKKELELCKSLMIPIIYEFYHLTKDFFLLRQKTLDLLLPELGGINLNQNLHVSSVLQRWKVNGDVENMLVLSGGSVVTSAHPENVTQFSLQTGQKVCTITPDSGRAVGLCEVALNGTSFLLVALGSGGTMNLYEPSNLYKCRGSLGISPDGAYLLRLASPMQLVCAVEKCDQLWQYTRKVMKIDVNHMRAGWKTALPITDRIIDMCCVADGAKQVLVVNSISTARISAYDLRSKNFLWSVHGMLPVVEREIQPCGVTTDGKGTLFVCDEGNEAIQMFSTDGDYIGCLLRKGQHGIESPRLIRWCEDMSSLVVYHRNQTWEACQHFISVLQVSA